MTRIDCSQVLPNCYLWVEKSTGMRYKVLKLPPSTTGTSVSHPDSSTALLAAAILAALSPEAQIS